MIYLNCFTGFFSQIVSVVVFLFVLKVLCLVLKCFRAFILPNLYPIDIKLKYGNWAVITGSGRGLGKAYAIELAKRGFNVVLISLTPKKLDQVAKEIQANYHVKVKTIQVDFTQGQFIYEQIANQLKDIPVGILINNVGLMNEYPEYFLDIPDKVLSDIILINNVATVKMTKIILPGMVERGKGAIVNIGSATEIAPMPLLTVYAASKAFVKSFSEGLRFEYSKSGITIQTISPFIINTNLISFSDHLMKHNIFVINPETLARSALNSLGRVNSTSGHWSYEIEYFLATLVPVIVRTFVVALFCKLFRHLYLKRESKKKNN